MKTLHKAIFLERDGVLNEVTISNRHQVVPINSNHFKLKRIKISPVLKLKKKGFLFIVTTNQPGLSDGLLARTDLDRMHTDLRNTFTWIDDVFFCPHTQDDGCYCHKPHDGLFTEAASKWNIDLNHSFIVSDKHPDHTIAKKIGATSYQVKSIWNPRGNGFILVRDLDEAFNSILQKSTKTPKIKA